MPLENPRSASMAYMGILLEKYAEKFVWYSLRPPVVKDKQTGFGVPYAYGPSFNWFSRFPNLKRWFRLFPWAWFAGWAAAKFGRSREVGLVYVDMAFEAVLAGRVAAWLLKLPMVIMIHDDPVHRIRVKDYPEWLVKLYEREVTKTFRAAKTCAVISDYMGEKYERQYGVQTTTLYPGVTADKCLEIRSLDPKKGPVMIGSVGSIGSVENWELLLSTVKNLNSKSDRRKFKVLHIGHLPVGFPTSDDLEVTGWVPESEFTTHLGRLDICFLNWSFSPELAETGRTSFPLKIHSYIRAQVPFLALGPVWSSVVRFVQDYQCGLCCTEENVPLLGEKISELIHPETYLEVVNRVKELKRQFSRDEFFARFEKFVSLDA
ncbi:MAG: glycosyltransferase [Anaerolineales bacterium]|nr:glycosyltransferase [Anaerolineales bacterium]